MDTPLFDGELVHARRMIYTPSAFAKSNLVHLQEVVWLKLWLKLFTEQRCIISRDTERYHGTDVPEYCIANRILHL